MLKNELYKWYDSNARDLPWRKTRDAYVIWLSEIILQQTRVEQGLPYFNRFLAHYPTVTDFALASEDELLKLWQGLGYYSRVRNMHVAAKTIVEHHGGIFPDKYEQVMALKGIGEYTAAAIVSFAYQLPYAVIDGNVTRFISRYFGVTKAVDTAEGKREIKELVAQVFDAAQPDRFNQAIMEFGALHCKPKLADCLSCIFNDSCEALRLGLVADLPKKKKKIKTRHRYFNFIVFRQGEHLYLQKRTADDVWKNLYEFPLIESSAKLEHKDILEVLAKRTGALEYSITEITDWNVQVLSHQKIHYRFIHLQIISDIKNEEDWEKVTYKDIVNFAVPKPIEYELAKILRS